MSSDSTSHRSARGSVADQPLVLVVDDYEAMLFLYSEYLPFAGFHASTAVNGVEDHTSSFPKSR